MRDIEFTTDHVDRAIDHVIDNGACDNGLLDDLHPDAKRATGDRAKPVAEADRVPGPGGAGTAATG